MGKQKYMEEIKELFEKSPVVDSSSILRLIKNKKEVKQYQKQLIRNLISRGIIKRLSKGFYTIYDDPSLAVFCFKPSYLGLHDSLSFHELWEQETIPIIITSRRVRQGIRKILGMNVLIKRLDKRYVFGFEYQKQGRFYLPYSDIEKTFIDILYFKQKISNNIIKDMSRNMNKTKLKSYLKIYPRKFRKRVLDNFNKLL